MIPLLGVALWKPKADVVAEPWPRWVELLVFFGVGVYAGAIQAGVGLVLLLLLARSGINLVMGNAIKSALIVAITAIVALPVFLLDGQVEWAPALVLSAGAASGGYAGARLAVERGEQLIRPVLVVAVLGLAGRMLGLY
jgi:uncharacterized membrane protein YfcA